MRRCHREKIDDPFRFSLEQIIALLPETCVELRSKSRRRNYRVRSRRYRRQLNRILIPRVARGRSSWCQELKATSLPRTRIQSGSPSSLQNNHVQLDKLTSMCMRGGNTQEPFVVTCNVCMLYKPPAMAGYYVHTVEMHIAGAVVSRKGYWLRIHRRG